MMNPWSDYVVEPRRPTSSPTPTAARRYRDPNCRQYADGCDCGQCPADGKLAPTLRDFGWADGGYTIRCVDCPKEQHFSENGWGAKRSWRCREHAQAALDKHLGINEPMDG